MTDLRVDPATGEVWLFGYSTAPAVPGAVLPCHPDDEAKLQIPGPKWVDQDGRLHVDPTPPSTDGGPGWWVPPGGGGPPEATPARRVDW